MSSTKKEADLNLKKTEKLKLVKGKSKAFIIANLSRAAVIPCTEKLIAALKKFGIESHMDISAKEIIKSDDAFFSKGDDSLKESDIVFVVGGDGSILRAAKKAIKYGKPILGINAGRLGFLSDLEEEDLDLIKRLTQKGCKIENRTLLEIKYHDDIFTAVNDVFITKTEVGKTVDLFVECSGREVCRYRADGIVIATPDGSTAYSMSAGGPVVDTDFDAIIMTPICPHSLISRSIVFSPDKVIEIGSAFSGGEKRLDIVVDGEIVSSFEKGERITVKRSDKSVKFVNVTGRGFYEVLNQKIIGRR